LESRIQGEAGREGGCEQSTVPILRLMEEVSCRAAYWVLGLGHAYQKKEIKKSLLASFL